MRGEIVWYIFFFRTTQHILESHSNIREVDAMWHE